MAGKYCRMYGPVLDKNIDIFFLQESYIELSRIMKVNHQREFPGHYKT